MWEYNHTPTSDELYHYGVIGMKWGIRRGRTSTAYAKASKKLSKLDSKIAKKEKKASKAMMRATHMNASVFSSKKQIAKADAKAKKAQAKLVSSVNRANKWYKKMEKNFSKTNVKMSAAQVNLGKKYAATLSNRTLLAHY